MLLTTRALFVHLPKTGGQWVTAVLRGSGIACERVLDEHALPGPELDNRFSFTFVRDPVTWWRSLWQWSVLHGLPADGAVWEPVAAVPLGTSYAGFMKRVLRDCPGQYGRIAAEYARGTAAVGRTEDLRRDLTAILAAAGEPAVLPELPPVNVTAYTAEADTVAWLDAEIRAAEKVMLERFYPA